MSPPSCFRRLCRSFDQIINTWWGHDLRQGIALQTHRTLGVWAPRPCPDARCKLRCRGCTCSHPPPASEAASLRLPSSAIPPSVAAPTKEIALPAARLLAQAVLRREHGGGSSSHVLTRGPRSMKTKTRRMEQRCCTKRARQRPSWPPLRNAM